MAEYLARTTLGDVATWSSAGTMAIPGNHATPEAVAVMRDLGIDMTPHRATSLDDADSPTYVFGMEMHHLVSARSRFPEIPPDRLRLLAHPEAVPDPYGRGVESYRAALAQITAAIEELEIE